jgi:hypothetical protein
MMDGFQASVNMNGNGRIQDAAYEEIDSRKRFVSPTRMAGRFIINPCLKFLLKPLWERWVMSGNPAGIGRSNGVMF